MKEKFIIALSHTLKGYLTEPNATRLIQKTFRAFESQLHASYSFIALQNKKTSYLDIVHSYGVARDALQKFNRHIGSNAIGRIFFKDSFTMIDRATMPDDYEEMKIENDYAQCIVAHIGWEGRTFGFLASYFESPVDVDITVKNFFLAMAGACSASIEKEQLLHLISELRQFDVETGIYTHQFFIAKLEKEIHETQFAPKTLALLILDMDNFKAIINLHGTDAAQEVLKASAEELKGLIRGCDVLGSLGVDEFILFMPDTSAHQAEKVIATFNELLTNKAFTEHNIKASFSCGITELHNKEDDLDALIHRAQMALYTSRKTADRTISIEL